MEKQTRCELDDFAWAVVSFDHIKAVNIPYDHAAKIVTRLQGTDDSSLCIVTADVARRLTRTTDES